MENEFANATAKGTAIDKQPAINVKAVKIMHRYLKASMLSYGASLTKTR